jgi:hypothetical protein
MQAKWPALARLQHIGSSMDILEILRRDHKEVTDLLVKLLTTSKRASRSRRKLFLELKEELELLTEIEAKYFFPVFGKSRSDFLQQAKQRHQTILEQLQQLDALPMHNRTWDRKLEELDSHCRTHIESEERILFTRARTLLDWKRGEELGKLVEQEKKAHVAEIR